MSTRHARNGYMGWINFYLRAIHSTEIRIPPGKGITWGVLRAGGFSGKNSLYTLFTTPKSFPLTMKMVVFTILLRLLPASSRTIPIFWKACLACSSKLSLMTFPECRSRPGVPDRKINFSAITACGKNWLIRGAFSVLKFFLSVIKYSLE
jgi:hypothetical protein